VFCYDTVALHNLLWRELEWIYIYWCIIFRLTTWSTSRYVFTFICLYLLSYQFSVFGLVNNFAVVVGLNSSVRVAGIRDEEYIVLLFLFFVVKLWFLRVMVWFTSVFDFDVSDCRSSILLSIIVMRKANLARFSDRVRTDLPRTGRTCT